MLGEARLLRKRTAQTGLADVADLADSADVRQALPLFAKDRKWIDDIHLQICRIPAPTFLEAGRAEWMATQFRALGWDAKIDRAGNVTALLGPDRGQPLVAITAHLDTVLAPSGPADISVDSDGRMFGPGVADNGCGLAALLAIAKVTAQFPPDRLRDAGLILIANVCEEGEGNLNGMRYLCAKSSFAERIKSFVVLDGPNVDHVTAEALACRRFEIVMQGPGGHSWSDHGTPNPVHALSRLVSGFCDYRSEEAPQPRLSFNFGVFDGGTSINAIPAEARVKVDLRCEDPAVLDDMVLQITAMAQRAAQIENQRCNLAKLTVKVREAGSRPGGKLDPQAPLLDVLRSVDSYFGVRSHLDCASTDANIPLSLGLHALSIGAGGQGGGAHTPAEWYHPQGRELGLRRIYLSALALLRHLASKA